MKIGVMVDSFRLPLAEGIKKAAEVGAEGIQIYTVSGETAPEALDGAKRRDILSLIQDSGLQISALCGDLGGHGFQIAEQNPAKIERSKKIVDLAADWGAKVVTTHIGVVPEDKNHPRRAIMREACTELAVYAESMGVAFAIETGPETPVNLKSFLDEIPSKGIRVNYDPANLHMVLGEDPVKGVYTLGDAIIHTHAKDGKMLKKSDPETVYGFFAEGGIEDFRIGDYFLETPLGEGGVDFPAWVAALRDIGYDGFLTIEREVGADPEKDIRMAVNFLKSII